MLTCHFCCAILQSTKVILKFNFGIGDFEMSEDNKLPLNKRLYLTINEASGYSGIGINTIQNLVKREGCPFVLKVGRKKMLNREGFEKYLAEQDKI